jgi:glycosyltransferase involved in cell wall biosynthesis
VLTPEIAKLVDPKPEPFAAAVIELIDHPAERQRLSAAAAAVAREKYSRESYLRRTAEAYRRLAPLAPVAPVAPDAPAKELSSL